jgi:allophanate hydrolase
VVPACRSLDCVSVFAHTIADAAEVLRVAAGPDAQDPYSRTAPAHWQPVSAPQPAWRLAVPHEKELVFETPEDAKRFDAALARAEAIGATITRVTIKPLLAVARRLYDGAWVAERSSALLDRVQQNPGSLHPVTRAILEDGLERRTVDAFLDFHAVAEARLVSRAIFAAADALLLPTHPGLPSLEEMEAHPIAANSRLGTYTNFVNLCDLAGIAVPNGRREDGIPCGVTFLAPAFTEGRISALAAAFTGEALHAPAVAADEVELFCIGAHMAGLPLNPQVLGHGGRFLRTATTAPQYRLYAMGHRPGMVRVSEGGGSVAGEVWALPAASLGPFLAEIPPPLGFGRVTLSDGTTPLGFLCEAAGAEGQPEITALGGWRAYLATKG